MFAHLQRYTFFVRCIMWLQHLLQKRYSSDAIDVHNENDKVINSIAMTWLIFTTLEIMVSFCLECSLDLNLSSKIIRSRSWTCFMSYQVGFIIKNTGKLLHLLRSTNDITWGNVFIWLHNLILPTCLNRQ